MKKYFLPLFLLLTLVSCNKNYNTTVVGSTQEVVSVSIKANDWQYTDNGQSASTQFNNNYFYAVVDMPEITQYIFDNGEVQAYIVYNNGTDDAMQHLLPYVRHYEEQKDSTWNFYTETVDCVYGIGWMEFNFRASDFAYEEDVDINPQAMDFRVVITAPAKTGDD